MKPNIPKEKKPPRLWDRMSEHEKKAIIEHFSEVYIARANHEDAVLQKRWLKLCCIVLHQQKDPYGKMRCMFFLKDWKRVYKMCERFETNKELDDWLDIEMEKIFGKGGYPTEWVDSLENGGGQT